MLLVEAGDRRGRGLRGRRRARARAVVRPARRRARRGVRRVLPALGRAARRRRHGPPAAPDRPLARARPHPHRPRRQRRRGAAHGPRQPPDRTGRRARRPRSRSRASSRALPPLCMREDRLSSYEQWGESLDDAMRIELGHAQDTLALGRVARRRDRDSPQGAGRHGAPRRRRPRIRPCPTRQFRHPASAPSPTSCRQPVVTAQPAETVAVAAQRMRDRQRRIGRRRSTTTTARSASSPSAT